MRKISSPALALLAAGMLFPGVLFLGNLQAQQAPAAGAQPSSPTNTPSSSPAGTNPGPAQSALATQKDKVSYALGMNVGTTLRRESVEVDPEVLAQGVRDALAGGKMLLTPEEARTLLAQLQQQMRMAEMQRMRVLADKNQSEGEAFLAANRTKPGVVTLPSGLEYKILQQGTGPKPTANDIVVCNYRGTLLDGTEFDSSYKRGQPVTVPVSRVIKGWTEALELMPVGSKFELYVPANLAYGERGAGAAIGPNATLIFQLELLSIRSPAPLPPTPPAAAPQSQPQDPGQTQKPGQAQENAQPENQPAATKP